MTTVDAIVLAGGRATRMGGVDKPALMVGGQSMLEAALGAVAASTRTVVVGPHRPDLGPGIRQTQEAPAGSGPVAAIAAGLTALADDSAADLIVVLAADMPFLTAAAVGQLISRAIATGADAVFATDDSGRPQYLAGVWRRAALAGALDRLETPVNQPMKALVPAHTATLALDGAADCDTPDDIARARVRAAPLSLEDARNVLRHKLSRLPARRMPLYLADGATLAEPLVAAEALPRFDVSAMDGYAVSGSGPWRIREDIGFAGGLRPAGLRTGEAVRIATGAHIPEGTGVVVRDEFVRVDAEGLLHRLPGTPVRDDVRCRGEDWGPGDILAAEGTPVSPALRSVALSAEVAAALVRGPVRARIVMTGDEIRGEGPLHAGQTRDSIGPVLPDLLSWCGIQPLDRVHLRDTPNGFDEVLTHAADGELLVVVGATGGGAADQLRAALDRARAHLPVHRLRLRPGGSTVVAEIPGSATVLGLPGNPFAAMATVLALAPAIVEGLTARPQRRAITGPLRNAGEISGPVPRVVPASAVAEGGWIGDAQIRTAHLAGLLDRDGLVVVPADAADGALVEFLPLPG